MSANDYFKEVRELIKEVTQRQEERQNRIDKEIDKLTRERVQSQKEIDKAIKEMSQKIGKLTDSWGLFVEGLVAPGVPKLLKKCDINIKSTYLNAESRVNGKQIEIDVMGVGMRNGHGTIVVCSVKNRLQVFDIDDFIERLGEFSDFFPEYADRELIGLVGGIRVDESVVRYAVRKGFYVLGSSGDVVKLLNKKDFIPKIWSN